MCWCDDKPGELLNGAAHDNHVVFITFMVDTNAGQLLAAACANS